MTKKYHETIEFLDLSAKAEAAQQWSMFEINYGEKVQWPLLSGRQGLGAAQYSTDKVMVMGGYAQGVFTDESFLIDVE